jgi:hypothetical protein
VVPCVSSLPSAKITRARNLQSVDGTFWLGLAGSFLVVLLAAETFWNSMSVSDNSDIYLERA